MVKANIPLTSKLIYLLLVQALKCLPPTGIATTPLVPWILWSIWKARNKFIFENFAGNPVDVLTQAIVAAREWAEAQIGKEKTPRFINEKPTPNLEVVVQTDAAWSEKSGKAGLAWIMKHARDTTKGQRGLSFVSSALVAEGLALRDAVLACSNQGVGRVAFHSDSRQLISAINGKDPPLQLYGITEDIHLLASSFIVCVFLWIPRERNVVTDLLAKNVLALYEQEVGEDALIPPPN